MSAREYYDEEYFRRQSAGGDVQGRLNAFKFREFVPAEATVLDFGCGSGALLRALAGKGRKLMGVEINPSAIAVARSSGLEIFASLDEIADASVDTVISNHALEHVEDPMSAMRGMLRVLKPGGRIILVVPCDRASVGFKRNDPDLHLYSWSAGNLGNLAHVSGFQVERVDEVRHRWPPKWQRVLAFVGEPSFHRLSQIWGRLYRVRSQVRLLAFKP